MRNNQKYQKARFYQRFAFVLFGLFLVLFVIEIGFRIGGFIILSLQEHRNLSSMKQKEACRILCLGESTTQNQYPPYLEEILNQRNIGIKFSVVDKAIGGITTETILEELESNLNQFQPDLVVTMMGINDPYLNTPYEKAFSSGLFLSFSSLRVYNLCRFVWLRVSGELKKLRSPMAVERKQAAEVMQGYAAEGVAWGEGPKKATGLSPENDDEYVQLGSFYRGQMKFIQAAEAFSKNIEINPDNVHALAGLGWVYRTQNKVIDAEKAFNKVIELDPKNDYGYQGLAWVYEKSGRLVEAEQAFWKAVEINPRNDSVYTELGWFYLKQNELAKALQVFKKALGLDFKSDRVNGGLSAIYREMRDYGLSKVYAGKAQALRNRYYSSMTVNNYHRLKQILDKRKIGLVCVQYPVRSIAPLKKIFEGEEGVIFVDNENIFKYAISKDSYKAYFQDMFAGDFGHCATNNKCNRLLAENIANVILKNVFKID